MGESVSALTGLDCRDCCAGARGGRVRGVAAGAGEGHFSLRGADITTLLILCGAITVVPLLFFAAAARRAPLSILGLLQYLTPVLQLLIAVVVLGEHAGGALDGVRVGGGWHWGADRGLAA